MQNKRETSHYWGYVMLGHGVTHFPMDLTNSQSKVNTDFTTFGCLIDQQV